MVTSPAATCPKLENGGVRHHLPVELEGTYPGGKTMDEDMMVVWKERGMRISESVLHDSTC